MKFEEWFEEQFPGMIRDARLRVKRGHAASNAYDEWKRAERDLKDSILAADTLKAARYAWNARGQA